VTSVPTVSIIIPAHNQSQYLGEAIRSVLAQTYADFEVVVVDDGSTDDTREVTAGFADARVRYVHQDNSGLSAARNTGIRVSSGPLLTFLDSDDLFLPDKLALLVAALEENPVLGLVAGQAILIDEAGRPLGEVFDRGLPGDTSELLLGNPLHVGSVLLRREWQERVGLFDESLRSYEDWDLWLRLARAGCPMGWVARPVSLYRFHLEQMTRIGDQMTTATFAVLDKIYRDPELDQSWRTRRNEAYSRAFLRAAAQSYTGRDFSRARQHVQEAVRLNPGLCADDAEPLARLVAGWANHVKTREPLTFLSSVYAHLPDEVAVLRRRRRRELAKEALQLAFAAHYRGDRTVTRSRVRQAIGYRPQVLLNRGVLSMILRPGSGGAGLRTDALARTAQRQYASPEKNL
jgi:glycosyltransferase involved in cell wall biosynthesis